MAKSHLKTTTKDLAKLISKKTNLSMEEIRYVLECLPLFIYESVSKGKDVHITNLGNFRRLHRKARKGQDFKGNPIVWKQTYRMQFIPSRLVRKKLQELANK